MKNKKKVISKKELNHEIAILKGEVSRLKVKLKSYEKKSELLDCRECIHLVGGNKKYFCTGDGCHFKKK